MVARREGRGKGIVKECGMDLYTMLYLKGITSKLSYLLTYLLINQPTLYSTGNSAECYVAPWPEEEFGGESIHVYVWLSH